MNEKSLTKLSHAWPMISLRLSLDMVILISFATFLASSCAAQAPGENLPAFFDQFFEEATKQAGPLAPLFGKISPEQEKQLEAIDVSPAEEKLFGGQVLKTYLSQLQQARVSSSSRGRDVQYLQSLCSKLKPMMENAARYPNLDIRVVNSESSDAYSIPGGHLLISSGMLESCGSEAALVGVLAHELSHLDRGHQLLPIKQSKLANQPLNFRDNMLIMAFTARPFHPEQESQADMDATAWMMATGYDARELVRLLESWQRRETAEVPWLQFVPGFVKTHPNPGKRGLAIAEKARQLEADYSHAVTIGVQNLLERQPAKTVVVPLHR